MSTGPHPPKAAVCVGVDNTIWGSDHPHAELTFPHSRQILAEILAGVPDDEQAKIAGATPPASTNLTWLG